LALPPAPSSCFASSRASGGIIHPLAQAILLDIYPKERHGKCWRSGSSNDGRPILGPLGGVITDLASWRWAFAINLPFGLMAIWLLRRIHLAAGTERDAPVDIKE